MIKRIILLSSPAELSIRNCQLVVMNKNTKLESTIPIEDIGVLLVENDQSNLTIPVLQQLSAMKASVIICDEKHMPVSILHPLEGNHSQQEKMRAQLEAGDVLKGQLWQQTIQAKIRNQASLLKQRDRNALALNRMVREVKRADHTNVEAQAAKEYWSRMFHHGFKRHRYGEWPNALLNYGYIVLRAAVARALTMSGLLPQCGIHHKSKYNAFPLADDIMEPYRPMVDSVVLDLYDDFPEEVFLNKDIKMALLSVLQGDVQIGKKMRPLSLALSETTASLARIYRGKAEKIIYPKLI